MRHFAGLLITTDQDAPNSYWLFYFTIGGLLEATIESIVMFSRISHKLCLLESLYFHKFISMQACSKFSLAHDRQIASQAQDAFDSTDLHTGSKMLRLACGHSFQPVGMINDKLGNKLYDTDAVEKRWVEHFAQLFHAEVMPLENVSFHDPDTRGKIAPYVFREQVIRKQVRQLARNKGLGLDRIPAEILQAAEDAVVFLFVYFLKNVGRFHHVPISWRGGRLQELWKRKGCSAVRDNYRGLLIADNQAKILTSHIPTDLDRIYHDHIPDVQFGAARNQQTSFASQFSTSFLSYCENEALCAFVLFLDLTKAFDFAIREILWNHRQGFSKDKPERIASLEQLGVRRHDAETLLREPESEGSVLEQLVHDDGLVELIHSLHTNT